MDAPILRLPPSAFNLAIRSAASVASLANAAGFRFFQTKKAHGPGRLYQDDCGRGLRFPNTARYLCDAKPSTVR
jgi:hypothetical protein